MLFADRVKETTATVGTGPLTLDGAVVSFRSFVDGLGSGNRCHYTTLNATDFETGIGTVGAGTLTRDRVVTSSNGGAKVNWPAGSKDVFATALQEGWEVEQSRRFTQVAHGFTPGTPVFHDGTDWLPAEATSAKNKVPDGLALAIVDDDTFVFAMSGLLDLTTAQWDAVTGDAGGLTPGDLYYVDEAPAGKLSTSPSNLAALLTGKAISSTVMHVGLNRSWGTVSVVDFIPTSNVPHKEGRVFYDSTLKAFTLYVDVADISLQVGQELWFRVRNTTGVTIPDGSLVYVTGAQAGLPTVDLALADSTTMTSRVLAMATHNIGNNTNGFVTFVGLVRNLDTSNENDGDEIYLSPTVPGAWTATEPTAPKPSITVGTVLVASANAGVIQVQIHQAVVGSTIVDTITFNRAFPDVGIKRLAENVAQITNGSSAAGALAALTFRGTGAGTPEGNVVAPVGSLFLRTDGGAATTAYVKESGTGNTGWVAVGGGSSPLTTKGDLFGFSTTDARVPVGANDEVLIADSTQALGVRWGTVGVSANQAFDSISLDIANQGILLAPGSSQHHLNILMDDGANTGTFQIRQANFGFRIELANLSTNAGNGVMRFLPNASTADYIQFNNFGSANGITTSDSILQIGSSGNHIALNYTNNAQSIYSRDANFRIGHFSSSNANILFGNSSITIDNKPLIVNPGGATEWVSIDHDATDGVIETGTGDLVLKPASGAVTLGAGGPKWISGTGTPEGAVTAPVGSLFSRTDGGASTTLYVKESGAGNTGWIAK